jgi:predicted secreted protein
VPDLELKVGELHHLELRGLGSAGYSWEPMVEGPEGVVEIRRAPSEPVPEQDGPPVSGSLPEAFQVEGVGPGRVRVRFTLGRSWEPDEPPLEEEELDVIVTT